MWTARSTVDHSHLWPSLYGCWQKVIYTLHYTVAWQHIIVLAESTQAHTHRTRLKIARFTRPLWRWRQYFTDPACLVGGGGGATAGLESSGPGILETFSVYRPKTEIGKRDKKKLIGSELFDSSSEFWKNKSNSWIFIKRCHYQDRIRARVLLFLQMAGLV